MNASKRAGTQWESDIVAYLRALGIGAWRLAQRGSRDSGDILIEGVAVTVEAKAERTLALGVALTEAAKEAVNNGHAAYVVLAKRRNKGVAEGYAIMPIWMVAELWAERTASR